MHLLSDPETAYAILALHHPKVFDIHEQHMLSPLPAQHPLATHSVAKLLQLPDLPGTVAVAEQLGTLPQHPKLFVEELGESGQWVPVPYVGDLLLFLRDEDGPYGLNWTIKNKPHDFCRTNSRRNRQQQSSEADEDLRHRLEILYFSAAHVRTEMLALSELDRQLWLNLREALGWDSRRCIIEEHLRARIVEYINSVIGTQITAYAAVRKIASELNIVEQTAKWVLYSSIWRREIMVDLFRPILMDRPLRPERLDPITRYQNWFRR